MSNLRRTYITETLADFDRDTVMVEIINLRSVRKTRQRADAARSADANRALHGRTKAEKARDAAEADRLARTLDGARRDSSEG